MGELHLEILMDRMLREFKVRANTGKPMVAYRETLTGAGAAQHVFDRELGGRRHFAGVALKVEGGPRGSGRAIAFQVSHEKIPAAFRGAVEQGIEDALATGVLARYPLTDVAVTVTGGAFDPDSSSEAAFQTAAVMALREAAAAASPALLEPIMSLEIVTPDEFLGDVLGDLTGRRGKVRAMTARTDGQVVRAGVPLAEMFGYSTAIRSLTRGRATYTMEPEQLEIVPEAIGRVLADR
jgi:elongation factor G